MFQQFILCNLYQVFVRPGYFESQLLFKFQKILFGKEIAESDHNGKQILFSVNILISLLWYIQF